MKKSAFTSSALLSLTVVTIFIFGCGGGGGSSKTAQQESQTLSGTFLDSAVEGLGYRTSSDMNGTTDASGQFKYLDGDDITFFVGNIELGKTSAKTQLTPFDFAEPTKIAQFLQSVDYDAQPNNGIKIAEKVFQAAKSYDTNMSEFDPNSAYDIDMLSDITKNNVHGSIESVSDYQAIQHAWSTYAKEDLKSYLKTNSAKSAPAREVSTYNDAKATFAKYAFNDSSIYTNGNSSHLEESVKARIYLYLYNAIYFNTIKAQSTLFWNQYNQIEYQHDLLLDGLNAAFAAKDIKDNITDFPNLTSDTSVDGLIKATAKVDAIIIKEEMEKFSHPVYKKIGNELIDAAMAVTSPDDALSYVVQKGLTAAIDLKAAYQMKDLAIEWNSYQVAQKLLETYLYYGFDDYQVTQLLQAKANEILGYDSDPQWSLYKSKLYFDEMLRAIDSTYQELNTLYGFNDISYFNSTFNSEYPLLDVEFSDTETSLLSRTKDQSVTVCLRIENNAYLDVSSALPVLYFGTSQSKSYEMSPVWLNPRGVVKQCSPVNISANDIQLYEQDNKLPLTVRMYANSNKQNLITSSSLSLNIEDEDLDTSGYGPLVVKVKSENNGNEITLNTDGTQAGSKYGELSYTWRQLTGPSVTFTQYANGSIKFAIPKLDIDQKRAILGFHLTVKTQYGGLTEYLAINESIENEDTYYLNFSSEGLPDGTALAAGETYTKTWKVQNASNVDLTSVSLQIASSSTELVDYGISPSYISNWPKGQMQEFTLSLKVPETVQAASHQRTWNFKVNGQPIPYKSGAREAYLSYQLNTSTQKNDLPAFTSGVAIYDSTEGFSLAWNSATGTVTKYELYRSTSSGSLGTRIYFGPETSFNDSGLSSGTTYYYTAKACNDSGCTTGTQDKKEYLLMTPPTFDGTLSTFDITGGFEFSWDSATGTVTKYELYRSTSSGSIGALIYSGPKTSFSDTSLTSGTTYYYTLKACNDSACTAGMKFNLTYSEAVDKKPSLQYNTPENASFSENFKLSLTASDDNGLVQIYGVILDSIGNKVATAFTENLNGTSATREYIIDLSVLPDGQYVISSLALDTNGQTSDLTLYTFIKISSTVVQPEPTTSLSASDEIYSDKVNISWASTESTNSYIVYRCANTFTSSCSEIAKVTSTTYDDFGILPGTIYYYRIKSVSGDNISDFSTYDAGSVSSNGIIPVTGQPVASDGIYSDKVAISWDAVSGTDILYRVYRCTDGSTNNCSLISTRADTTHNDNTVDGVKAGITYYYRVKVLAGSVEGEFSAYDTGYLGEVAATVQPPVASQGVYGDKVHVSWNHLPGATHYSIYACDNYSTYPDQVLTTSGCREVAYQTALDGSGNIYTQVDDMNVIPGTKYWYYVRARNSVGWGEFSEKSNSGYAGLDIPLLPVIHASEPDIAGGITLQISNSGDNGAVSYEMYRCNTDSSDSCVLIDNILPYGSTYESELAMNTLYYYRAKSVSYSGNKSDFSAFVSVELKNNVPFADAGPDMTVPMDEFVTIIGSGTDSDGSIASYSWTENGVEIATTASFTYKFTLGIHYLHLSVTDNLGLSSIGTDVAVITAYDPSNTVPVASPQTVTVEEGSVDNIITLTASDGDGDALTYVVVSYPSNGSLSGTPPHLTYTPADNYGGNGGNDSFTFKVNDGKSESSIATVSIVVNPVVDTNIINHNGFVYGTVTSSITGRIWLDRNLGASRVCTSSSDSACYGDYYQWGRNTDGHEKSASATSSTISPSINPGHSAFILVPSSPYDWTSDDSIGGSRSANWNICPSGFRVPTINEFAAENISNSTDAFNKLQLPNAGYRDNDADILRREGEQGGLWSTSVDGWQSVRQSFDSTTASTSQGSYRASGYSVRCIQN